MKTKRTAIWILACVMVLFTAFTIGCKGKNDNTAKTVKEITLSDATAEIKAGGAIVYADYTVTANYTDGSNKVVPLTEKMFKAEDLAKFENAGTYEIEVSAFGKTTLLTVTVTNYTFEGVTAADVNAVYDGTAKVPTLNNAPAGATAVWTYYAGTDKTGAVVSEAVNAGTYYAEGVVSLKYYNDATVSANVVIAKKAVNPAELKWENLKRVYTGSAIDANVTASDLPEGVTVSYEGDGKTGTAVGKYTVTLKFDDSLSQNYEMTAETYDVEWEIIAPLDATWFGAENGALCVADFKSDSETSGTLTFNGQTTTYTVAFDDKGNATFADASFGKTVTFAYNGVDYKGNLVKSSPSVRIVTVAEYEFFFGSTYYESDNAYGVTVNGKTLKFDYEIKSLSQNYTDYQFAFKSLSFDGKAATANAIYYSTAAKTVVFTTADGTYAYNLTTKALTDNVTFEGVAALINNKNTSDGSVYVTARITSVEGKVAKVGLFYDFGNKGGLKAVTATAVEGGYKLSGEGLATTYLLEEGDAYALYTEEQYLLAGTYAIGGKDLVITGTHANGKFTYTAAYGGAEAVAVTPDFTAKSFMIKGATSATIFGWTNENGVLNFTATELPAAALDFLIDGDYMINLDSTYNNFEMRISLKGVDNGKVKFNVSYSTGWSWSTAEGTLSDDGTYISAYVYYSDIQIYANAKDDYYYKLVAVKKSSAAAKYLGTFTVNETEKVSIALGATSCEDEDGELDGLDTSCFMVTYKGKTVKASTKYSASVSEIEFTVDGKTYVAKLVDGAMTVTEKAAA